MPNKFWKFFLPTFCFALTLHLLVSYSVAFAADITAPSTTYTISPSAPNGNNGWYTVPVTFTLNATDLESGVKEINYRIDSSPWQKVSFQNTLNLAPNPSFEDTDINSDLNTQYWHHSATNQGDKFSRDQTTFAPGYDNTSIKIETPAPGWHAISHSEYFAAATPFKNMSASIWVKTSNAESASFKIFAVSKDGLGNNVYTQIATSNVVSGTNDWTLLSSNFIVSVAGAIGVYMEAGIQGTGTVWFDAASINDAISSSTAVVTIATDGQHTFYFYSVDRAGNTEATKTVSVNIDQTPPGTWHQAGAIRVGNDHTLMVYATVNDDTSGLSTWTGKYQYLTETQPGFGVYSNLLKCNSTWKPNQWQLLLTPPFIPGVHEGYVITLPTDFCNSNWKICKTVRFYSKDMAGNVDIKDICVNGPWIKLIGKGIVGVNGNIDMLSDANGSNTDGLIEMKNSDISFFSTSKSWIVKQSNQLPTYSYSNFWNNSKGTKHQINTGGSLVSGSGLYYIDGSYTITNTNTPSNYGTSTFSQVVFVNGDLRISRDIAVSSASAALFIVKGKVEVSNAVNNVRIAIMADGNFYTAYDRGTNDTSNTLNLNGVFAANKFYLQRTLFGTQNANYPSELFTYEPKYLLKIRDYLGTSAVKWGQD